MFVGLPTKDAIPVDIGALVDAELDVYGVFRYANTYPAAIQIAKQGQPHTRYHHPPIFLGSDRGSRRACSHAQGHQRKSHDLSSSKRLRWFAAWRVASGAVV